ncbi:MAG: hypothetical protein ACRD26_18295 [Vicinamibacterales bacterium]
MNKLLTASLIACASAAAAQEVLDRVLARVEGAPITLSDTRAAIRLRLVEIPEGVDPILAALRQLVERRLVLAEVARFTPAEPDGAALDAEVSALVARVGTAADLAALEKSTGYGDAQIREVARDDLRIQAYLAQRFGASVQPTDDEVAQYYRTHLDEFTRDGRVIPFLEAEPVARAKMAAERRRAVIFQWMRELRQRADVVELYPPK